MNHPAVMGVGHRVANLEEDLEAFLEAPLDLAIGRLRAVLGLPAAAEGRTIAYETPRASPPSPGCAGSSP